VHPTSGILRDFQAVFKASAESCSQTLSTPAHLRVTQTVGHLSRRMNFKAAKGLQASLMLRTLADKLYGKASVVEWFKSKNPNEEVLFASAATVLETSDVAPVGWSFQRLLQRRGVVIVTKNQITLKNNLFSLSAITYLFLFVLSLVMLIGSQDWDYLLGVIVFGMFTAQFLPYEKQILVRDIQRMKLGTVRGIVSKGSLLTVFCKGKSVNIVPAQLLSEDVVNSILPNKK
jgi:hypothetical protein